MKKFLKLAFVALLIAACLSMSACSNKTFDELKDAIREEGELVGSGSSTQYSVKLDSTLDISLYYVLDIDDIVGLNMRFSGDGGSTAWFTMFITEDLTGEYHWPFSFGTNSIGGTFYANKATSTDVSSALVEDPSERSSGVNSTLAKSMRGLAETMCGYTLSAFKTFIEAKTNIDMSEFGYYA